MNLGKRQNLELSFYEQSKLSLQPTLITTTVLFVREDSGLSRNVLFVKENPGLSRNCRDTH